MAKTFQRGLETYKICYYHQFGFCFYLTTLSEQHMRQQRTLYLHFSHRSFPGVAFLSMPRPGGLRARRGRGSAGAGRLRGRGCAEEPRAGKRYAALPGPRLSSGAPGGFRGGRWLPARPWLCGRAAAPADGAPRAPWAVSAAGPGPSAPGPPGAVGAGAGRVCPGVRAWVALPSVPPRCSLMPCWGTGHLCLLAPHPVPHSGSPSPPEVVFYPVLNPKSCPWAWHWLTAQVMLGSGIWVASLVRNHRKYSWGNKWPRENRS